MALNKESTGLVRQVQDMKALPAEWNTDAWLAALRGTLWKDLNPVQFLANVVFAGTYGLNPFLKEVMVIQGNPFVGRDGFLKKAEEHPRYVDHVVGQVYEGDGYVKQADGTVKHITAGFGSEKRGEYLGAYCTVWTKGVDREVRARTFEREPRHFKHLAGNDNWKKDTEGMVLIRTITWAMRSTLPLGNLYTVEEAGEVLEGEVVADRLSVAATDDLERVQAELAKAEPEDAPQEEPPLPEKEPASPNARLQASAAFLELCDKHKVDISAAKAALLKRHDLDSGRSLTKDHYEEGIEHFEEIVGAVLAAEEAEEEVPPPPAPPAGVNADEINFDA